MIYKKILENMSDFFFCIKLKNNDYIFPEEENEIQTLECFLSECDFVDDLLFHKKLNKWYQKKQYQISDNNVVYFVDEYRDVTCFKEKEELLKIDFVTTLPIRKVVVEKIKSCIGKASILVLGDIDYFKKINDSYGHDVGDIVLNKIGTVLKKYIDKDIVGRFGGEEFILFFQNKSEEYVLEVIEKMKNDLKVVELEDLIIDVHMSFGYTINHHSNKTFEKLLKEADQALYYAKENGRNKVICFDEIFTNKKDEE